MEETITVVAAAELLNVSLSYLNRLLDTHEIPFREAGMLRELRRSDVLRYKQQRDAQRQKGMEELVRLSEELGLYGDEA